MSDDTHRYRLYFLDGRGRVEEAYDLLYDDDEAALSAVPDLADGRPMELWLGTRQVKVFPRRDGR